MNKYTPSHLSKSEAFNLVVTDRRRTIIRVIANGEGETTVENLVKAVAAHENENSSILPGEEQYKQIRLALLHRDIPKLADNDVVVFNRDRKILIPGDCIDDLLPLI